MRNYELTLLISPQVGEEEANQYLQRFISFLQDEGALFENHSLPGKRTLLAPIQKQKSAFLALLTFQINQEKLPVLEKHIKETPEILRHMLLSKVPSRAPKKAVPAPFVKTQTSEEKPASPIQAEEKKADLQEIDKKLEEIFKEA